MVRHFCFRREKTRIERNATIGIHLRIPVKQQGMLYAKTSKPRSGKVLLPGFSLLSVQRDGVHFTTATLRSAAAAAAAAEDEYATAQQEVERRVVGVACSYAPALERLASRLGVADALYGFAVAAAEAPATYCVPVVLDEDCSHRELRLTDLRHAAVEAVPDRQFVPNDVALGAAADGERRLAIVTGPNMGGKSTFTRSVAVAALLCQAGCLVPATAAVLPVFDSIFARVGVSDLQVRGVSGFMAEMLETASVLRAATSRSLVVVDELGRGTSSYDGFGLAAAVAWHLSECIGCISLFATHFHEVCSLLDDVRAAPAGEAVALQPTSVAASACQNDDAPLPVLTHAVCLHASAVSSAAGVTMLYRILPGVSKRSFGISVAELAGFPEAVTSRASEVLQSLVGQSGDSGSCDAAAVQISPAAKRVMQAAKMTAL